MASLLSKVASFPVKISGARSRGYEARNYLCAERRMWLIARVE